MDYKTGFAFGIFESYGSFTNHNGQKCISINIGQKKAYLIDYVLNVFGGKIFGPYRGRIIWRLCGSELNPYLKFIENNLSENKRLLFKTWINKEL